jgi:hypothetical protein
MSARGSALVVTGLVFSLGLGLILPCAQAAQNPPIFTSVAPVSAIQGELYEYDANATDPDNDQLTYYLKYRPEGMTIDSTSGYISWTPMRAGNETITVYVTDSRYEVSQSFNVTVAPRINNAPVVTSSAPLRAFVGQVYVYDVNATDPEGEKVYFFLGSQPPKGMAIDQLSGVVTWTPGVEYTNNSVFVLIIAKDATGLEGTQTFNINVTKKVVVQNQPPSLRGTPVATATVGELYFYPVDVVDPDGDVLSYCFTVGPPEMEIDPITGVILWTPSKADVRVWDIRVLVSDGQSVLSHNFSINVHGKAINYNEDPAQPAVGPEGMAFCLIIPVIAVIIQLSIVLSRTRGG